jgi:hypothetical protein
MPTAPASGRCVPFTWSWTCKLGALLADTSSSRAVVNGCAQGSVSRSNDTDCLSWPGPSRNNSCTRSSRSSVDQIHSCADEWQG